MISKYQCGFTCISYLSAGPVTETDVVIDTIISPTCTFKHLVCGDVAALLTPSETSVIPDIRVVLPLIEDMAVYDDDVFLIAYAKTGNEILHIIHIILFHYF